MIKRPLYAPHNASDGQHETRGGTTTRRLASPACLPIRRRDDAACLLTGTMNGTTTPPPARLPTRATGRRTPRRLLPAPRHDDTGRAAGRTDYGTRGGTNNGMKDGTHKNGPPLLNERRPENGTRYITERDAANYSTSPSLSESSGKRGKSRRRAR